MTPRQTRTTSLPCTECGWWTTTTTPGLAASALRKHKCSRHVLNVERAARVKARKESDGPKRECTHPIAQHRHGTRTAYVIDKCRCRPCREASATAEARRVRAKAYGTWQPYIDAQPTRDHILALQAQGLGLKRIAAASGVPHGVVSAIVHGKHFSGGRTRWQKRLRPETAQKLLTVTATLDDLGATVLVEPTGSRRRIEAMLARGWSINALSQASGVNHQCLRSVLSHVPLQAKNARGIRDAYDQLWDTPPRQDDHRSRISVSRALKLAHTRGYLPPLAWDDDDIDDPYAGPSQPRTERANAIPVDDIEWLIAAGGTWDSIATRLNMQRNSLHTALTRAGRQDLITRLTQAAA